MVKLYSAKGLNKTQIEVRNLAMADLKAFVRLVAPNRMLGHCHYDMLNFLMEPHERQLVLWPRGHQKSTMIAFWTLWHLVNNPESTVLYVSDSSRLAQSQLGFIKQLILTDTFNKYWPEFVNIDENKREMWRNDAICIDHPFRKESLVRDPSILAVGMGAGITGFHFDALVLDDVVVYDNSATPEERNKSQTWFSLMSSILNPGGFIKAVGTRYHPLDLYQTFIESEVDVYNEVGDVVDTKKVWAVSQEVVEIDGQFLWPRMKSSDGKWYGFNSSELNKKKADYINKLQFFAQYYNNPNDPEDVPINNFNYYDKDRLYEEWGGWYYRDDTGVGRKLNVFAAIDFASTMERKSDYTCIVVVGIDHDHNILILEIDRFKTDKISVMHDHLTRLYNKWNWSKLRGEATQAQNLIIEQLKEFNRKKGIFYSIELFRPTTQKEIRIMTNLEPRYSAGTVFHYRGGNCELLEEELTQKRPRHDDIKDALASVIEIVIAPGKKKGGQVSAPPVQFNRKFGGVQIWQ